MSQLQKTPNFKFVHIVSILHDADATLPNESFHLLVEHVMQFIDFNKQAIRYNLDQQQLNHGGQGESIPATMFNSQRFNFTKFIASLIMKEKETTLRLGMHDSERYIRPLANFLRKLMNDPVLVKSEIRDKLELIISNREANWLANSLWLLFVEQIKYHVPSLKSETEQPQPEKIVQDVSTLSLEVLSQYLPILDMSLTLNMVQDLYVDLALES